MGLGLQSLSSLSFGAVNPSSLILPDKNPTSNSQSFLLWMVIQANSPQIIFSMLYFFYNRSYTAMLAMVEWTNFAVKRQSLRVSQPIGIQRSTYWLQLPYLYSLPLLIGSGVTHWALSQSLFLVRVSFYDRDGQPMLPTPSNSQYTPISNTFTVLGYSPKAILTSIIITVVMLAVLIGNQFRRYPSAMPLAVNCSFAISAACHQPDDDPDASYKRVCGVPSVILKAIFQDTAVLQVIMSSPQPSASITSRSSHIQEEMRLKMHYPLVTSALSTQAGSISPSTNS